MMAAYESSLHRSLRLVDGSSLLHVSSVQPTRATSSTCEESSRARRESKAAPEGGEESICLIRSSVEGGRGGEEGGEVGRGREGTSCATPVQRGVGERGRGRVGWGGGSRSSIG